METRESIFEKLVAKSQQDAEFRGHLLANPHAALKEVFNIELPDDYDVVVHEDSSRTAHLVLPADTKLTDEQLRLATAGVDDDWGHFGT